MSAPRLVTVLFTDLVASTETVARLGPEAGQAWRLGHLDLLREALSGTGGREVQAFGDGLLVLFEAASAAVVCAAAMQQRVARANARRDALAETAVRVGIALGEATEDEQGVHGLVVVEAARLCAAAKGGQVLASALVETLSAGRAKQRFTALGALELKGLPAPVAVVEVEWRGASPEAKIPFPPALAEAERLSFVGRAAEREKLAGLWQRAQAGDRGLALIAGEPGIGKTRLAAELAGAAAEAGAIVLFGRSDEDLSAPFQPFAQALGHYAAHVETETLRAEAGPGASDLARLVPELARRLGVAPSAPSSAEPEADRARLFDAIDELLANATRGAPVLVVLDDLHWADKPSLVLLRALLRSARPAAVLLVGTYRETDLARTHPLAELLADLRREPRVERVLLRGLVPADVSALVAARGQQEPPAEFVAALHAETDGNPFFVEEVLRHLIETGALRRQDDGRWTSDRPIEELGIPEGVREVVGRRLSRLSETANQALGVAAVIGREFDAALIEAAGGPSGDALLDALDEAARARLIAEAPGALGRFAFAHALVRQTLYEELGITQRVRLHWRIGEALERRNSAAPEAQLSAIAHHLCQGALAGDAERAVEVTLRAAARAEEFAAHEEVIALTTRALALLDQAGLAASEVRYRAWMLRGAAELRLTAPGYATSFAAAEQLAERLGRPEWRARAVRESSMLDADEAADERARARLAQALAALPPGDGSERCLLLARLAVSLVKGPGECEPFADEALAMARRLGGVEQLEGALNAKALLLTGSARVDELAAVEQEMRGLALGRANPRPTAALIAALRADRPGFALAQVEFEREIRAGRYLPRFTTLHTWSAADALAQGRFAEARVASARARESVLGVGRAIGFAGHVTAARLEEGRISETLPRVEQFAASAPVSFGGAYRCIAVALRAMLGDGGSATRELEALVAGEFALRQRRRPGWPLALRYLCEAAALLGHEAAARALEPEVADYSGLLFVAFSITFEGAADRALGQVLAVQGRLDEACARYERALALEEGFEAWALAARTRYWWARALAERGASGDREQARALLDACLEKTRAFGMLHLTEQAEALAAQLTAG